MAQGVHRVTPTSRSGRRMTQAKGSRTVTGQPIALTQDQLDWNEKLARKNAEKKLRKQRP